MVYPGGMAMIAQSIVVSPKVYRHFAVLTVTVTALIAIFADGERREEIADHIEAKEAKAEARRIEAEKNKAKVLHKASKSTRGGGGGGGGGDHIADFGEGMIQEAAYSPGARRPANLPPPQAMSPEAMLYGSSMEQLPDVPPPGMSAEVFQRLKRVQQQRLKKKSPDQATAADMRRMDAASAARSGVESEETD